MKTEDMISRPEYFANKQDLHNLAEIYTDHLLERLKNIEKVALAVHIGRDLADEYYKELEDKLLTSLNEIGLVAAKHYAQELGLQLSDKELQKIVEETIREQRVTQYYGLTYEQRLIINRRILHHNIIRSATVGRTVEHKKISIARALTHRVPFGAHENIDQRFFLSEAVYLQHRLGLKLGAQAGRVLVKWNLSETHPEKDVCDELATDTDKDVIAYIKDQHLDIDPKGVYFIDSVPDPPHPNCQCELTFLVGKKFTSRTVERTVGAIQKLISRLRRGQKRR